MVDRKPVRSVQELAREFGISPQKLGPIIQNDHNAPKPVIVKNSFQRKGFGPGCQFKSKHAHYDYAEALAWWQNRTKGV